MNLILKKINKHWMCKGTSLNYVKLFVRCHLQNLKIFSKMYLRLSATCQRKTIENSPDKSYWHFFRRCCFISDNIEEVKCTHYGGFNVLINIHVSYNMYSNIQIVVEKFVCPIAPLTTTKQNNFHFCTEKIDWLCSLFESKIIISFIWFVWHFKAPMYIYFSFHSLSIHGGLWAHCICGGTFFEWPICNPLSQ